MRFFAAALTSGSLGLAWSLLVDDHVPFLILLLGAAAIGLLVGEVFHRSARRVS